jgi:ribonuclease Z
VLTLGFLGTGAAIPGRGRDNTSLALDDGKEVTLVDVSGSPIKRLVENGFAVERLARVIITHQHVDHTYGFPSLLQGLWLMGRREPLSVYAGAESWAFLDRLVEAHHPSSWTRDFPVARHLIAAGAAPTIQTARLRISAEDTIHSVPTVALRIETAEGRSATYSSDTAFCEAVVDLARGSDVLIHEATYLAGEEASANRQGHSTSAQAAQAAVAAGAKRLVLVHFTPRGPGDLDRLQEGAAAVYAGPIDVPSDGARIELV